MKSSTFVSILSPSPLSRKRDYTMINLPLYGRFNPSSSSLSWTPPPQHPHCSYIPGPNQGFKFFQENNAVHALSSSSLPSLPYDQHRLGSLQHNSFNFCSEPNPVAELPSIQSLVHSVTPTCSSDATNVDDHDPNRGFSRCNSGLLEDLIGQSQALIKAEKSCEGNTSQGNYLWDYNLVEDSVAGGSSWGQQKFVEQNQSQQSTPAHSSFALDDEQLVAAANWYHGNGNSQNQQSSTTSVEGGGEMEKRREHGHEHELLNSPSATVTSRELSDHDFIPGTCCWKNMPGVQQI